MIALDLKGDDVSFAQTSANSNAFGNRRLAACRNPRYLHVSDAIENSVLLFVHVFLYVSSLKALDGRWEHWRPDYRCSTLPRVATLTIRIDDRLDEELRNVAAQTGAGKSAFVREAVRRHLAITRVGQLRRRVAPFAEAHGWLTDEDVFNEVS